VRRYDGTLLIKPSTAAIQRIRERLRTEMRTRRGSNAAAILAVLTPIIRGWAAYYRGVVSSKTFKALDNYLWALTYKWATRSHATKPKTWVVTRYYGKYNKFRNDHWVFGDVASGAYLVKFSWTDIVRHTLVKGGASPDDPALTEYWAKRRQRLKPPLDGYTLRLLTKQDGRCPLCGDELLSPEQPPQSPQDWERWWLHVTRRAIVADYLTHHGRPGSPDGDHTRLELDPPARTPDLRWLRPPGRMLSCLHLTLLSSAVERSSWPVWAGDRSLWWPSNCLSVSRVCGIG
jgi:RNA-directed DNA polymerase